MKTGANAARPTRRVDVGLTIAYPRLSGSLEKPIPGKQLAEYCKEGKQLRSKKANEVRNERAVLVMWYECMYNADARCKMQPDGVPDGLRGVPGRFCGELALAGFSRFSGPERGLVPWE
jgi:hypothetical protein